VYVKPIKFLARWTLTRKMGRKGMESETTLDFILLSREWKLIVSTINDSRFVMYSQSGDHLQKYLAKFSYRPDEKVQKKSIYKYHGRMLFQKHDVPMKLQYESYRESP